MRVNPEDKRPKDKQIEKWVLMKAFEDLSPDCTVWRQKEQFSDGVGYNWIDTLKKLSNETITDEQLANAKYKFPINTPTTKEEYYYRSIFNECFPSDSAASCVPSVPSVACSTPEALAWDEELKRMIDPSGRAMKNIHKEAYK